MNRVSETRSVILGVTSHQSLKLLGAIPKEIERAGWAVHIVVGEPVQGVPRELEGLSLHVVPMVRTPSPLRDLVSFFAWLRLLSRLRPDVLIVGTPKASLLGMVAGFLLRVPARVYQLRGLRLETVPGLLRLILHAGEWITARCSTSVLAVSESLRKRYCELRLCQAEKVSILGLGSSHGVDTELFHPDRWDRSEEILAEAKADDVPVLGFVGRFSIDKGTNELVLCSQSLTGMGLRHRILILGSVEDAQDDLKTLMEINEDTIVTGHVENTAPYYSIMDILLLPTYREGFPNAVLEAAASGVPTVTTTVTGAIDSVIDGKTGLLVPPRDGNALAKAVFQLIERPDLRKNLGANAREWVVSNFSSDFISKQYVAYIGAISGI